ncbi:uncharacterized protein [Epargyreus clarus]|uniref:uncharacterized protein isoform X2 n=1 Tax=Epargyreus clarus TaxID=520877 RepID=UPI003C2D9C48
MHFWIDKRSQCAYTGRHRVPSSLSAGVGVGRSRGRVYAGRKGMPHRLAPAECAPRRPRVHRHYGPPPMPAVHSSRRQEEPSLYVEVPPEPPQPTIASLAAARSVTPDTLLRTAALGIHHSPMMAPHLKFGMLVSFALATVFLAGAKYYFDRQVSRETEARGGEAGVVCAAVACVCGVGCALSLCRARPAPLAAPERVSSTARRAAADRDAARPQDPAPPSSEPSDDISLATLLQTSEHSGSAGGSGAEAPPPYHIAVLLPARSPLRAAAPPPAYSALS